MIAWFNHEYAICGYDDIRYLLKHDIMTYEGCVPNFFRDSLVIGELADSLKFYGIIRDSQATYLINVSIRVSNIAHSNIIKKVRYDVELSRSNRTIFKNHIFESSNLFQLDTVYGDPEINTGMTFSAFIDMLGFRLYNHNKDKRFIFRWNNKENDKC